ncbi:MAG: peptide deformylase [Chitinophagales bacterium]
MILPIVAFGDPVLRQETNEIDQDYPKLNELIENMKQTMHNAPGVGLAAPQIGLPIRLFVVDTESIYEDEKGKEDQGIQKVFINPIITEEWGKIWDFEEGCLSIPGIREKVKRQRNIKIEYYDENFILKEEAFDGLNARVIQHEYDHIEGVLFTDHLGGMKKRRLQRKLRSISKGDIDIAYKMRFPKK